NQVLGKCLIFQYVLALIGGEFWAQRGKLVHKLGPEIPTAAGLITRLAYERAQAAGIELEPLLKKAGLTKQPVEDVGARISAQYQIRFLNLVASALRDEFLGFHLAEQLADLRRIGLLYYIMASSDALGDGLKRVVRYGSMINESVFLKY